MNRTVQDMQRSLYIPLDASIEERKQRLLNILLTLTTVIVLLILAMNVAARIFGVGGNRRDLTLVQVICVIALLSNLLVYVINRYSPRLAGWIFVLSAFVMAVLSGSPYEVAGARSLITLAVPVAIASILLHQQSDNTPCRTSSRYVDTHSVDGCALLGGPGFSASDPHFGPNLGALARRQPELGTSQPGKPSAEFDT